MKAGPLPFSEPRQSGAPDERGTVRELLLDTAEQLFAENGVAATSVRAITASAGANVAAINYYFGSREGLLRELISRRLEPLNQERLRRLAACHGHEAVAVSEGSPLLTGCPLGGGPGEVSPPSTASNRSKYARPTADEILDALATPALNLCFEQPHFARLASRLRAELDASLWREYRSQQAEVTQRFEEALQAALPELDAAEVNTRLHYVLGGLQHVWAHCPLPPEETPELTRRRFLSFYGAGLKAPGGKLGNGEMSK